MKAADATPPVSTTPLFVPTENQVSPSAFEELKRVRLAMPGIMQRAAEQLNKGSMPFLYWGAQWSPVQKTGVHGEAKWFFIGDIHGDFFALHTLLEEVRKHPDAYVCFLGDLVDRGPHGMECFARLLEFAENHRGSADPHFPRIVWILGNHDEGISINHKSEKRFDSRVEPAEFVEFLNKSIPSDWSEDELNEWGALFVEVCERLPRAIIFQAGLLATHGGFPLEDRWPYITTNEALHHQRCLGDFTWTRASTVPSKKGWKYDPQKRRHSSSFEYGYKDFEGFCKAIEQVFPVKCMVRGHDHVEGGFEIPKEYKETPLLTLNGFGFNYLSNSFKDYRPTLTLGVSECGEFPKVLQVPYLVEEFQEYTMNENLIVPT